MLSVLLVCRDGTLGRLNMVDGTSRLGQITHPCESRPARLNTVASISCVRSFCNILQKRMFREAPAVRKGVQSSVCERSVSLLMRPTVELWNWR